MGLLERADQLPTNAGVYLFKDRRGKVIYVGKAINLRARVRQYVSLQDERFMVPHLVDAAVDVDFVVVNTEKEALLLENTLIKKHQPRFNTKLVDDKNFLHLRIEKKGPWPRYTLVRRIKDDGARYFGPFASASRARSTLAALSRHFPLRTCTDAVLNSRKRPCILHQMHRCNAPCVGLVTKEAYDEVIDESLLFLGGQHRPLVKRLNGRMRGLAEQERYEEAARLRDLVRSIEATLEKQTVVDAKLRDRDVWGLYREGRRGGLARIAVREGMMGEPITSPIAQMVGDDADVLSTLLVDAYAEASEVPGEILVPVLPADAAAIMELLSEKRGRKVEISAPERGDRLRLIELANENARQVWLREHGEDERRYRALDELRELLGLKAPPRRIECFDNSNVQGSAPVAAMSVFIDGKPARAEYRRFRIKTVVGANDFASMREILGRRVARAQKEGTLADLLVVDGGHGQVNAAMAALKDLGVTVPLVGISKPRTEHARGEMDATDKIVVPGIKDPLRLSNHDPALRMLQYLRDEVHRHAIGYHRQVRDRETLVSVLEGIPGVGDARRKALLSEIGSVSAVADADVETIAAVSGIGKALAERIWAALHPETPELDV